MTPYTLDTNILIRLARYYPREYFANVWVRIEELVEDGRCCICSMVAVELERGTDELLSWAKSLDGFIHEHSGEDFTTVGLITSAHPDWVVETKNAGDPFVIAHALNEGSIIVTEEARKGPNTSDHNLKIPNVADEHGVECINFLGLLGEEGWSF